VQVGTADAACADANQHLSRRCDRDVTADRIDSTRSGPGQHHRIHRARWMTK
jgi:hypothetical protein